MNKSAAYKAKKKRLFDLYRITPEEQDAIEQYQRSSSKYSILLGQHLGLDHDHTSGLIRGRIDFRINKAIGYIEAISKENAPAILRAMAHYLDKPPALAVIGHRWGLIGKAKYKKIMKYGPPDAKTL